MIRAFVFDLDGTLVETEELKALSYARAAAELRPGLDEGEVVEAFKDLVGLSRQEVAVGLMRRFGLEETAHERMKEFGVDTPWQAYVQIRLRIYETLLADPNIVLAHSYPHNIGLLRDVRRVAACAKQRCSGDLRQALPGARSRWPSAPSPSCPPPSSAAWLFRWPPVYPLDSAWRRWVRQAPRVPRLRRLR